MHLTITVNWKLLLYESLFYSVQQLGTSHVYGETVFSANLVASVSWECFEIENYLNNDRDLWVNILRCPIPKLPGLEC